MYFCFGNQDKSELYDILQIENIDKASVASLIYLQSQHFYAHLLLASVFKAYLYVKFLGNKSFLKITN